MIKMFASDLDGTLLNALHEADGTIRRAIRELIEAGLARGSRDRTLDAADWRAWLYGPGT